MGFLKRLLSLGGRKSKKQRRIEAAAAPDPGLSMDFRYRPPATEEEAEAIANRLLRSSSARYAVVAETECNDLPPLPHPIDRVLKTPTGSYSSLRSGSFSRGTYKVTVHQKERHLGSTASAYGSDSDEFDNMVTPRPRRHHLDANPQDTTAVIRLRSDPSVASLLDLYDEHGRLPEQAFSNASPSPPATPRFGSAISTEDEWTHSPSKDGRAQTRRTGSTLRQLLGTPSGSDKQSDGLHEGDISWAERFLGENTSHSACSSISSFGLETPQIPNSYEPNVDVRTDTTFSSAYDDSTDMIRNPTISSISVELSTTSDFMMPSELPKPSPYQVSNPATPQRASQVFDFLTEKRRSHFVDDFDRPLPEPPSAFSSPSSAHGVAPSSRFSTDTSFDASIASDHHSVIPEPCDTSLDPIMDLFKHRRSQASSSESAATSHLHLASIQPHTNVTSIGQNAPEPTERKVKVILTNPQTVMVTAPTPNHHMDRQNSRIPRGPRSVRKAGERRDRKTSFSSKEQRSRFSDSSKEQRKSLADSSNCSLQQDKFTAIPSRPRKMQPRHASTTSTSSTSSSLPRRRPTTIDKENGIGLTAKADLPYTPLRSGNRSLLRTVVTPGSFVQPEVPSPASSSDLSPVGQKVMLDARRQRVKDRQRFGPRDILKI